MRIILFLFLTLSSIFSYSQKVKSITEFKKVDDSLIKSRVTNFDKFGNLTKDVWFGKYDSRLKTFRNKIRTIEYVNRERVSEYFCEDFVSKDTCVIRSFSIFEFDNNTGIEKQTKYESDSLIRFIREVKKVKRVKSIITYSWEFMPVEEPDYKNAVVIKDTIFFDKKNRKIKRVSYSNRKANPKIELFDYSKGTYKYRTIGTYRDTVLTLNYSKLQRLIDKKSMNYFFINDENYKYKIEYY